jgi:hypothetical protein
MSQECHCPHCERVLNNELECKMHIEVVHFPCPSCGLSNLSYAERSLHLASAHGKWYESENVDTDWAESLSRLVDIPDWQPPQKSIPTDRGALYEWLRPLCLRIVEGKTPDAAFKEPPVEMHDQVEYVKAHFARVKNTLKLVRYKRLRDRAAKANYLVIALAHLECSPSYALQQFHGLLRVNNNS